MAKYVQVTLAHCATLTDMSTGKTWKKGQSQTMTEAAAARYASNPKFTVKETEAPKKAKAKPAVESGGDEGGDETKTPTKKAATKKKAS